MKIAKDKMQPRRGAVIPLTALLITVLVGMVAFAVDLGWIAVSQSELQNAADAAALAGAGPLMDGYVYFNLPNVTSAQQTTIASTYEGNAKSNAKTYAGYNSAGGVSSLTLLDADIQFGFMDANNNYTAAAGTGIVTVGGTKYFPNTIKVTMRRDGNANGVLGLFFANIFGMSSINLTATASATIYGGTINTLAPMKVLPMTFDVNTWNNYLATGQNVDGNTSTDSSGYSNIQVYPSVKDKGNFGQLSLDDSNIGTSTINSWIQNGISSADITALQTQGLIPLSSHAADTWDWQGSTGFTSSIIQDVNNYVGQTYVLPLFFAYSSDPANYTPAYTAGVGQGSNYYYDIVQFVGIRIEKPNDANRQVVVQPAAVSVPSSMLSASAPAGSGLRIDAFVAPKLTR